MKKASHEAVPPSAPLCAVRLVFQDCHFLDSRHLVAVDVHDIWELIGHSRGPTAIVALEGGACVMVSGCALITPSLVSPSDATGCRVGVSKRRSFGPLAGLGGSFGGFEGYREQMHAFRRATPLAAAAPHATRRNSLGPYWNEEYQAQEVFLAAKTDLTKKVAWVGRGGSGALHISGHWGLNAGALHVCEFVCCNPIALWVPPGPSKEARAYASARAHRCGPIRARPLGAQPYGASQGVPEAEVEAGLAAIEVALRRHHADGELWAQGSGHLQHDGELLEGELVPGGVPIVVALDVPIDASGGSAPRDSLPEVDRLRFSLRSPAARHTPPGAWQGPPHARAARRVEAAAPSGAIPPLSNNRANFPAPKPRLRAWPAFHGPRPPQQVHEVDRPRCALLNKRAPKKDSSNISPPSVCVGAVSRREKAYPTVREASFRHQNSRSGRSLSKLEQTRSSSEKNSLASKKCGQMLAPLRPMLVTLGP